MGSLVRRLPSRPGTTGDAMVDSDVAGKEEMTAFGLDLARMYAVRLYGSNGKRWTKKAALWILNPEFHVLACYRYGQFARSVRSKNAILGRIAIASHYVWNSWTTHIDHAEIHRNSKIGPGFLIMHRHGLIVEAVIGSNCVIHQNVTVGQHIAGGDQSVPRIGNNVWIGPGAIITGAITIGDGATISAGTVISKDVPPHSLVAGNPGRVIVQNYDNSIFLGAIATTDTPDA